MPLILGTNSIKDTGYDVANSLRFNSASADSLTRSTSGAGTSNTTFTISLWVKKSSNDSAARRLLEFYNNSTYYISLRFRDDHSNRLDFYSESNGSGVNLRTNRSFRDPSAWYHIVMRVDTTQSTADDRLRMYVNGVQETSFAIRVNPGSSENLNFNNSGNTHLISKSGSSTANDRRFNGYMAEVCFIDGQSLDPTSFGEFDSDSPTIWKPKDVSGLTFGNNGFYLDFENSGSLGADVSGNSNNFTVNNLTSVDQSTDTCTNNFCTLNPLGFTEGTLSEGNLEIDQNGSAGRFCASTFQVTQGKWYFEAKLLNYGSDPRPSIGVGRNEETFTGNASAGASSIVYGLENTSVFKGNTDVFTYDSSPSSGDIYGVAFDLDNLKIYFHKNGNYANSGNPGNGTGNVTTLVSGTDYSPITGALNTNSNSARNNDWQFNFGSPIHSITSGNSDANGFGNFEYEVPPGFFSLCTKNLAEYG